MNVDHTSKGMIIQLELRHALVPKTVDQLLVQETPNDSDLLENPLLGRLLQFNHEVFLECCQPTEARFHPGGEALKGGTLTHAFDVGWLEDYLHHSSPGHHWAKDQEKKRTYRDTDRTTHDEHLDSKSGSSKNGNENVKWTDA